MELWDENLGAAGLDAAGSKRSWALRCLDTRSKGHILQAAGAISDKDRLIGS